MSADFKQVVDVLKTGRAVVFPTDTVYGLGVAVCYAKSPQEIFDLKRRPAGKPIAWLVGGVEDLDRYGSDVSDEARELVRGGWPGSLTVIVKASAEVPAAYRSAAGTIGLRMPDSKVARALIDAVGPLAASSANLSGRPVPRSFADIDQALLADVTAALEGDCPGSGMASTVIDASGSSVSVLRAMSASATLGFKK